LIEDFIVWFGLGWKWYKAIRAAQLAKNSAAMAGAKYQLGLLHMKLKQPTLSLQYLSEYLAFCFNTFDMVKTCKKIE
jgi:hypothetical protein